MNEGRTRCKGNRNCAKLELTKGEGDPSSYDWMPYLCLKGGSAAAYEYKGRRKREKAPPGTWYNGSGATVVLGNAQGHHLVKKGYYVVCDPDWAWSGRERYVTMCPYIFDALYVPTDIPLGTARPGGGEWFAGGPTHDQVPDYDRCWVVTSEYVKQWVTGEIARKHAATGAVIEWSFDTSPRLPARRFPKPGEFWEIRGTRALVFRIETYGEVHIAQGGETEVMEMDEFLSMATYLPGVTSFDDDRDGQIPEEDAGDQNRPAPWDILERDREFWVDGENF